MGESKLAEGERTFSDLGAGLEQQIDGFLDIIDALVQVALLLELLVLGLQRVHGGVGRGGGAAQGRHGAARETANRSSGGCSGAL